MRSWYSFPFLWTSKRPGVVALPAPPSWSWDAGAEPSPVSQSAGSCDWTFAEHRRPRENGTMGQGWLRTRGRWVGDECSRLECDDGHPCVDLYLQSTKRSVSLSIEGRGRTGLCAWKQAPYFGSSGHPASPGPHQHYQVEVNRMILSWELIFFV